MIVVHVTGYSGSGKTSVCRLLAASRELQGRKVAFLKHHHGPLDRPESDTASLAAAGVPIRMLAGGDGVLRLGALPTLSDLLQSAADEGVDLALVEGFKKERGAKVWLRRTKDDTPPDGVQDVDLDIMGTVALALSPEEMWRMAPRREHPAPRSLA